MFVLISHIKCFVIFIEFRSSCNHFHCYFKEHLKPKYCDQINILSVLYQINEEFFFITWYHNLYININVNEVIINEDNCYFYKLVLNYCLYDIMCLIVIEYYSYIELNFHFNCFQNFLFDIEILNSFFLKFDACFYKSKYGCLSNHEALLLSNEMIIFHSLCFKCFIYQKICYFLI